MKKNCELCNVPARIFCESDQAALCWDCDAQVHAANFLVARHSRTLLCRTCHSLTPWNASGSRLGNTVSFCHLCIEETAESEGSYDGGMEVSAVDGTPPPASSEDSVSICTNNGEDGGVSEPVTTTTSLKRQREDNGA